MNWKYWLILNLISSCVLYANSLPFEIRKIPIEKPYVALTFDDGPTKKLTPQILNILAENNITATFFLQAKHVEDLDYIALQIYAAGHTIGNHGYKHDLVTKKSPKELIQMIAKSQKIFYELYSFLPKFYRPAYSHVNPGQIDLLKMHFQHLIRWSIDPQDWNKKKSNRHIIKHIIKNIEPGSIIILHETDRTIKILPSLIRKIKKKGYTCIDLETLIHLNDKQEKVIKN